MPRLYEPPVVFLRELSKQVQAGWALVEFDYDKERVVLRKGEEVMKATLRQGRVEWRIIKGKEAEVIKGTDRFFII
jgi:hypothetical protein